MNESALKSGFSDPVHDSQTMFRHLLHVMSRPGEIQSVQNFYQDDLPLKPVQAACALTLLDYETPFWLCETLDTKDVVSYVSFHTGAQHVTSSMDAAFLFIGNISHLPELRSMALGVEDYPDRSATIVMNVKGFDNGQTVSLSGPGIETKKAFCAADLDREFWSMAQENNGLFPLGVDFIFCSEDAIAALPRSTKIEIM